jgi:hypothetical protein
VSVRKCGVGQLGMCVGCGTWGGAGCPVGLSCARATHSNRCMLRNIQVQHNIRCAKFVGCVVKGGRLVETCRTNNALKLNVNTLLEHSWEWM